MDAPICSNIIILFLFLFFFTSFAKKNKQTKRQTERTLAGTPQQLWPITAGPCIVFEYTCFSFHQALTLTRSSRAGYNTTGSPSSKYEHRRTSALLRNIQNERICIGKKPIASVTYENERISIKNSLPYLKCVLRLSCVVHGRSYGRLWVFM